MTLLSQVDPNMPGAISPYWLGVTAVASVLLTKATDGIVVLLKTWSDTTKANRQLSKEERADALMEWKEIAQELQERAEKNETEYKARFQRYEDRIYDITKAHGECERKAAEQQGEIRLLQANVQRLQGIVGDEAPATIHAVTIVADLNGNMLSVSPNIASLLHWLPNELVHRKVDVLVPPRLLKLHTNGLERCALEGQPPWTEKRVLTFALNREGAEIPVAITYTGWKEADGTWRVAAEIVRRPTIAAAPPEPPQPAPAA